MGARAATLILNGEDILLIHRIKETRDYYTLPGGSIEAGETAERACLREIKEETSLDVFGLELLQILNNRGRTEHYFLAKTNHRKLVLGEPERSRRSATNRYEPMWVNKEKALDLNVQPVEVLEFIQRL